MPGARDGKNKKNTGKNHKIYARSDVAIREISYSKTLSSGI